MQTTVVRVINYENHMRNGFVHSCCYCSDGLILNVITTA